MCVRSGKRLDGVYNRGKPTRKLFVPGKTCTANLYMLTNNAILLKKKEVLCFFRVEADTEACYIGFRNRIPADANVLSVLALA